MNLIEFSKISNQSIDNLKELLMIQFNRIVLSEYVGLDEKVLHELMDYFGINQIDSVSHTDLPEGDFEKQGFSSEPTDEEQCFRELSDILHPEIKYTRKLLEYCSEHNYLFFIDTCSLLNQYFYQISLENYKTAISRIKKITQSNYTFTEYLEYWHKNYIAKYTNSSSQLQYFWVIYKIIMPKIQKDVLLSMLTDVFVNDLISECKSYCPSAGEMTYKVLRVILQEAEKNDYISEKVLAA